jgi:hypothetical protein
VRHADILVGHQTQPHDPPDTGRKAARLLLGWLAAAGAHPRPYAQVRPAMAWRKIPMMTQQDMYLTAPDGPMKDWSGSPWTLKSFCHHPVYFVSDSP